MPRIFLTPLLAAGLFAAQPDYFPLKEGNQWTYRASRFGTPFTVEVVAAPADAPDGFFAVRGFPGGEILLRMADDGTLYSRDPRGGAESVWAAFGAPVGEPYATSIDRCNKTAVIRSKAAKADVAFGQFENALSISYPPSGCADAGIASEMYLPYAGLLQRTVTSFAGPVVYDLVYARLNDGLTVMTAPEQSFTLALDSLAYSPGAAAMARLTVRNTQARPLRLSFPSGQRYDLAVRDSQGKTVYQWSGGKAFTMVSGTVEVGGEKTWTTAFPAPGQAGIYQVEAWLATDPPAMRGSLAIEVK